MNPESNSALPVHGSTDSNPVPAESAKELSVQTSMSRLQIHSATTESCSSQSQQFLHTELDSMVQPDRLSSALPVSCQDTRSAVSAAQSRCTMHVQSEPDEASLQQPSVLSAPPQAAAAMPASAMPSQEQSADACFLQNLFCCPLTQVGHQSITAQTSCVSLAVESCTSQSAAMWLHSLVHHNCMFTTILHTLTAYYHHWRHGF